MKVGLLLLTHNDIGSQLLLVAKAVFGDTPSRIELLPVDHYDQPADVMHLAKQYVKVLDEGKGVLILTDMYGSTPSNIASEFSNQKNVNVIDFENKNDSIIKIYDSHNIFILPSFTEGHPQVVDESLSRLRPVIVFKEISHVIGNREGIFISERNSVSLHNTINYIISNFHLIEKKIAQNVLPTKKIFLKQMLNIIEDN